MGILSWFGFGKTVPPVTALDKRDEFLVGLASVLCEIDGEVAKEEGEALVAASRALEPPVHNRLADLTANRGKFHLLQQWCRGIGLHEDDRTWIGEKLIRYADIDRQRTSEENAFLVQAAQILEGNEQLPLFVGASAMPDLGAMHDLFDYLTEAQYRERFPASACDFKDRQLYTLHPYLSESLMRFSIEDFRGRPERGLRRVSRRATRAGCQEGDYFSVKGRGRALQAQGERRGVGRDDRLAEGGRQRVRRASVEGKGDH